MQLDPRQLSIDDFYYPLPEERIAKYPLSVRDHSKLLVYRGGELSETRFSSLPNLLPQDCLLVFNNTKVIQARLHFRKETGALIELFCLEPVEPNDYALNFQQTSCASWLCMVGNLKRWKEGVLQREMIVKGKPLTLTAERERCNDMEQRITFRWNNPEVTFADILEIFGELPIPPYLNRKAEERDKESYQTVYSKIEGSVAAPTAGLHFTPNLLEQLEKRGIEREELTLHVGAGTFKPVKSSKLEGHVMHTEYIAVHRTTLEKLITYSGKVIAVGTTSVRTLESLYYIGSILRTNPDATEEELSIRQWQPYQEEKAGEKVPVIEILQAILAYLNRHQTEVLHTTTQLLIVPGYEYKIVKGMITNFHQPKSTLLLLVSAFVQGEWRKIYDYALTHDFRFLSYGDSSLLMP